MSSIFGCRAKLVEFDFGTGKSIFAHNSGTHMAFLPICIGNDYFRIFSTVQVFANFSFQNLDFLVSGVSSTNKGA